MTSDPTVRAAPLRAPAFIVRRLGRQIARRDILTLVWLMIVFSALVAAYTVGFQLLSWYEGREQSWLTGVYWTLTTMSTLGYGDITFTTDLGRLFSMVVLLSGIIFMLVLLPFTFIEFFYGPWIEARAARRLPRELPDDVRGHVVLTLYGPVATSLIAKLEQFNYPYVVVMPELDDALRLSDAGIRVVHGALDDPETYRRVRVDQAALVATTRSDIVNTTVVFTVRGLTEKTPVVATAREEASAEVLKLAGCTRVISLTDLTAGALARRAFGGDVLAHVVGRIDDLLIAEVDAGRTALVGTKLAQARRVGGVSVVGLWQRGRFEIGEPDSTIEENTILVMAGSTAQLRAFNDAARIEARATAAARVVIIGGGRVGRATAAALERRGIDYRIVEVVPERIRDSEKYVLGSGTEKAALEAAGIDKAASVIITTHDDETNIYLTIFCRLLRPNIQIISRASLERTVATLHRAGSDFVMSYASMGANALFNLLQRSDVLMIAEGLDVFKVPVPEQLAGKTVAEANIRDRTGCSVIGIDIDDTTTTNPEPDSVLPAGGEIVLIGTPAGETEFLKLFTPK